MILTPNEAALIAPILKSRAEMLRRRHPSDGLFQNAYTHEECEQFKIKADRLDAIWRRIESKEE